ncbi:long-chain-fatty-acid--CoA ligase [Gracilaria domingensis]|nr:long-chain-fatty-acid--CoA ligase [Gracilaria domingensis]
MSETASSIILQQHPHPGFLVPHFAARVMDVSSGLPCVQGQRGELWLRGSAVFTGYAHSDKREYMQDGFFRTGDVVVENKDGSFEVLGRTTDSIRSAGETVWPVEVETTLLAHPAVREAAVVGVPHRILGEAVVAAVVLMVKENASKVVDTLMGACRETLAHYKCPKHIFVTGCLPKNPNGKISRVDVRRLCIKDEPQAHL